MKHLKKILLVVMLLCCKESVMAQSIISFTGGLFENSTISVGFSAGEVISGSFSNSTMNLIGGFAAGSLLLTSNEKLQELPRVFKLNQNYPNPFNPSTIISYDLPKTADVSLEIYNSIGAKVAVLVNEQQTAGRHNIRFNASSLASGMYFYRITAGSFITTKKMILIK